MTDNSLSPSIKWFKNSDFCLIFRGRCLKQKKKFKAKDSEIKKYSLCLGNVSGDFPANNKKKTGLNGCVYNFSVDYRVFDNSNITNMYKYLMKKSDIKYCLV